MQCYSSEEEAANASWWNEDAACRKRFVTASAPAGWCPGTFDGWNCWNHTRPNTTAIVACPQLMLWQSAGGADHRQTLMIATKFCQDDGTWWRNSHGKEWANYTACFDDTSFYDFHQSLSIIWYIGYTFSIALCLVALIVHQFCKTLDCGRTKVHQHLFASYVLNCCSQIAWLRVQADVDILVSNPIWCQALHVVAIYLLLSNYAWMFSEGLYLYCILKISFVRERLLMMGICVIGWGFPMIPTVLYVFLRLGCVQHSQQLQNCWTLLIPNLWWSYASFALACQIFNFTFLIAILKLVYMKSAEPVVGESSSSVKKLIVIIRALFILVPLFGVQYLLSCFYRPTDPQWALTTVYEICYAMFTSLQGAAVATLFCFCNAEVKGVVSRKWFYWRSSRCGHSLITNTLAIPTNTAAGTVLGMHQFSKGVLPSHRYDSLTTVPAPGSPSFQVMRMMERRKTML